MKRIFGLLLAAALLSPTLALSQEPEIKKGDVGYVMWPYATHYRGVSGSRLTVITIPRWVVHKDDEIMSGESCIPNAGDLVSAVGTGKVEDDGVTFTKVLVRITKAVVPRARFEPGRAERIEYIIWVGEYVNPHLNDLCSEGTLAFVTKAEFEQMRHNMQYATTGQTRYPDTEHSTDYTNRDREMANHLLAEELSGSK